MKHVTAIVKNPGNMYEYVCVCGRSRTVSGSNAEARVYWMKKPGHDRVFGKRLKGGGVKHMAVCK